MQRAAQRYMEEETGRTYQAEVLEPVRMENHRPAIAAGAEEDNLIDMSRMIENARKRKENSQ
ncbi:hypothetical protein D3C76_1862880 [compost metagenome]